MKKRKRLYDKDGTYNKHGKKFNKKMTKALGKILDNHAGYDWMDMERIIIRTVAYVSTTARLRENAT